MRSKRGLMTMCLLLSAGLTVSACETPASRKPSWPDAADLRVEPKPTVSIDILSSDIASAKLNESIETQRDTLAGRLERVCQWFKAKGMPDAPCK